MLRSHGLEVLVQEQIPLQDPYRPLWNESHLMGYEEFWAKKLERQDHGPKEIEESRSALRDLAGEMRKGVSLHAEYFCFVARKILGYSTADDR